MYLITEVVWPEVQRAGVPGVEAGMGPLLSGEAGSRGLPRDRVSQTLDR